MTTKAILEHYFSKYLRKSKQPLTEDDIVSDILRTVRNNPPSLFWFISLEKEDLTRVGSASGRAIREHYGLWRKKNPNFVGQDPSDVAVRILGRVWDEIHAHDNR